MQRAAVKRGMATVAWVACLEELVAVTVQATVVVLGGALTEVEKLAVVGQVAAATAAGQVAVRAMAVAAVTGVAAMAAGVAVARVMAAVKVWVMATAATAAEAPLAVEVSTVALPGVAAVAAATAASEEMVEVEVEKVMAAAWVVLLEATTAAVASMEVVAAVWVVTRAAGLAASVMAAVPGVAATEAVVMLAEQVEPEDSVEEAMQAASMVAESKVADQKYRSLTSPRSPTHLRMWCSTSGVRLGQARRRARRPTGCDCRKGTWV